MREFSEEWRSHTNKAKKIPKGDQMSFPQTANVDAEKQPSDPLGSSLVDFNPDTTQSMPSQIPASIDDDKTTLMQKNPSYNAAVHPNETKYLFGNSPKARIPFRSIANIKIQAVVKELQQLEIDKYTCSVQFLLRTLIEESCKHYIAQEKIKCDEQALRKRVKYLTEIHLFKSQDDHKNEDQKHNKKTILSVCDSREEGGSATIESLQTGVHSSHDFLSPSDIRALWRKIQPFITKCLK